MKIRMESFDVWNLLINRWQDGYKHHEEEEEEKQANLWTKSNANIPAATVRMSLSYKCTLHLVKETKSWSRLRERERKFINSV